MNEAFGGAMRAALLVGMALMIVYQFGMLYWTKKSTGSVPKTIKVLRGINVVLLVLGIVLISMQMAKG